MIRFKCFSVCFCLITLSFAYEGFPTKEDVSQWAEELKIHLHTEFDRLIGVKNLEKVYDDLRKAKLHKIDGYDLVHKMSKDMTENFKKKMRALKKLVAAAEKTVKHYKYNHLLY
ncbi:uncharacterized protein LOC118203900 [Stegodyphus dumicola]|uniref:uncharacterized protein LOC118203900 n=1 Tax=Stegodyphus dumicola TaxID=202533 RepID=UPI0015A93E1D|nr:uncharacterized protein LOC118203900 [Stegodyphus dumicola]